MNRFKRVIDNYQTTTHVPEALERLVECDLALGLTDEAKANAAVLGYNYPGSEWYEDSLCPRHRNRQSRGAETGLVRPQPRKPLLTRSRGRARQHEKLLISAGPQADVFERAI